MHKRAATWILIYAAPRSGIHPLCSRIAAGNRDTRDRITVLIALNEMIGFAKMSVSSWLCAAANFNRELIRRHGSLITLLIPERNDIIEFCTRCTFSLEVATFSPVVKIPQAPSALLASSILSIPLPRCKLS